MPSAAKSAVAPLFLLACLILGGSAQGIWENAVLQLAGLAIIAWSAAVPGSSPLARPAKLLLILLAIAVAYVVLQSVPMPSSIWAHGARTRLADGYGILGVPTPWLPLSLTPYESLATLLRIIPAVAVFCGIVRLKADRPSWLAAALLIGAMAGILLGAVQVMSANVTPRWYPYSETNLGVGVGFFANANHMANLLVISLPFLAAIVAATRGGDPRRGSALMLGAAALGIVILLGIVLNHSLAGYALAVPVVAASAMILLSPKSI